MANANDDRTQHSEEHDAEFEGHLRRFLQTAKPLVVAEPSDPVTAQYIVLRNSVFDAVESREVIADTVSAWSTMHSRPETAQAAHLLMLEVAAFSAASEVATSSSTDKPNVSLRQRLLSMGSTIVGSLSDVLELSKRAKAIWKIVGELFDLFKGK